MSTTLRLFALSLLVLLLLAAAVLAQGWLHRQHACVQAEAVETKRGQLAAAVEATAHRADQWSGTGLYIRGSMVAMFNSEVATEPWSIRVYTGAGRYWGLHQSLRDADHDVPLEPVVLNAQRLHYKEISKSEFATLKATIEALPN